MKVQTDLNQRRSVNNPAGTGKGVEIEKFEYTFDFKTTGACSGLDATITVVNKYLYKEQEDACLEQESC
jgi:hypothetical protein